MRACNNDRSLLLVGLDVVAKLMEAKEVEMAKYCVRSIRENEVIDGNSESWKIDMYEAVIQIEEGESKRGIEMMEKLGGNAKTDREYWYTYANILKNAKDYRKAILCVLKALEISPDWGSAEFLAARIHQEIGEDEYAIHFFNSAVRHGVRDKVVLEASSFSYLRSKRYEEGWLLFENRPKSWNLEWLDADWEHGDSLKDKSVVVIADEGIGDVIMFAPLLKRVIQDSSEHVVYCDQRLKDLVKRSIPELTIESQILDNRFKDYEIRIRLGSLASIYWNELNSIKDQRGYLQICQKRRGHWQDWLNQDKKSLNIGIAWEGGAHDEKEKTRRSIELNEWKVLLQDKTVSWVSLQKDPSVDKINELGRSDVFLRVPTEATYNIDDLAALVSCLDMVICCEQTVAHIAGGVGLKTIVITGNPKGWRYVSRTSTSSQMVWYSNVRLLSRDTPDFWSVCQHAIAEAKIERGNWK